jgi:hypothetical protein
MSFDIDIPTLLQYAFNIFASILPLLYLFVGAGFAIFIFGKLIQMFFSSKT